MTSRVISILNLSENDVNIATFYVDVPLFGFQRNSPRRGRACVVALRVRKCEIYLKERERGK